MISGPTHPLNRDGLWHLVCERPDLFERGLRVVHAGFGAVGTDAGMSDGLARDAAGAPCLVLIIDRDEPVLLARVLAAHAFVARNAAALSRAIPEAEFEPSGCYRMLLIGAEIPATLSRDLERLQLTNVRVCLVETFRLGGHERVVVRAAWPQTEQVPELDPAVAPAIREQWDALIALLQKLDPALRLDGDRFSRRALWHGRLLCDFWFADDRLLAQVPGGSARTIVARRDVQTFGDQVMRRFVAMLSERDAAATVGGRPGSSPEPGLPAVGTSTVDLPTVDLPTLDAVRSAFGASRLTREEYSALGDLSEEHVPEGN